MFGETFSVNAPKSCRADGCETRDFPSRPPGNPCPVKIVYQTILNPTTFSLTHPYRHPGSRLEIALSLRSPAIHNKRDGPSFEWFHLRACAKDAGFHLEAFVAQSGQPRRTMPAPPPARQLDQTPAFALRGITEQQELSADDQQRSSDITQERFILPLIVLKSRKVCSFSTR